MASNQDFPRHIRVGDQIQRELAQIIARELKDPRIPSLITITSVDVARDMGVARIFVSSLIDTISRDELVGALTERAGFMRSILGKRLRIRAVPELRFSYDDTTEKAMELSRKIDEAIASHPQQTAD
ncbi:MAG: 30S ribosome-binding factor RbfA [Gammaproteobacteria bacterium]|nr:30S ribosome-binding factor RbfA [Gammaproteobacteria bacterium]